MQDRPYQIAAHAAIRSEYIKGVRAQIISMATGTGKTVIFSQIPSSLKDLLPGQTLVLAHRGELISQAISKMRAINPSLKVSEEKGGAWCDVESDVIVASVATLGRTGTKRGNRLDYNKIDTYIVDEAHHSTASTYTNILESANLLPKMASDKRLLMGFTATPQRGDGKALAAIYQKIVYSYSMRQAIGDGYLADVKGLRIRTDTSLDDVHTVAGDFNQGELADTVNTSQRNCIAAEAWLDNAKSRTTIGFTVDIQHARDLSKTFLDYGILADYVWGDDPDRAKKLALFEEGYIDVLFNCGVLTEGYDCPRVSCILNCAPTKSNVKYVQCVGRGTRLFEGKTDCLVLDLVDNSSRHSLVTVPSLMGMSSSLDLKGQSVYEAIKKLEGAQKEFPNVDFSKLTDITKIKTLIEAVNLFDVPVAPEVENNSQLCWHPAANGGYVMLLPNQDEIRLTQNMLEKWELRGTVKGKKYKAERDNVEAIFSLADGLVNDTCSEHLKILTRKAAWHEDPPTGPQLGLLAKLYKGKALPNDLSKGMAARLIGQALAGKKG